MRYRVLTVGTDVALLTTRQALLISGGYDSVIATPDDLNEKLHSAKYDLVILSAMLSQEDRAHILVQLPPGTRPLVLETLVWPKELLRMVAAALGETRR
jgi:DNA-binding response OmpR family regulator